MAIRERKKRIYRKRIPYGMQNFEDIRERDCYYVDKTPFIEDIEDSNMYFFYIRPRRFGKSLTLSMNLVAVSLQMLLVGKDCVCKVVVLVDKEIDFLVSFLANLA